MQAMVDPETILTEMTSRVFLHTLFYYLDFFRHLILYVCFMVSERTSNFLLQYIHGLHIHDRHVIFKRNDDIFRISYTVRLFHGIVPL
jgi:hypothetical protein